MGNIATSMSCCECDAMPSCYTEYKGGGMLVRKYYCKFHLKEAKL